jgi:hypothetical protein
VIRDFHPLAFFYALGFAMSIVGFGLVVAEVAVRIAGDAVSVGPSCWGAVPHRGLAVSRSSDVVRHGVEQRLC